MCNQKAREKVSEATVNSTSWFGGLVYVTNTFLWRRNIPMSNQSANFVIENVKCANRRGIFSSTAHRREAWHWLNLYRRTPTIIPMRIALCSLDPNWYLRGFVLNTTASFWNCIDPGCEGSEFMHTGFDPGIDIYNLFKRAQGKNSVFSIDKPKNTD